MANYLDTGSDLDMLSQTENEGTDNGEVSSISDTSITPSSAATDSSLEMKPGKSIASNKQCLPKLSVNINADLTDVTDLDENTSSTEDNTVRSNVKSTRNHVNRNTGLPKTLSMDNWYNQECFKTYWDHYNQVMQWCSKHFQVYNNIAGKISRPQNVPSQVNFDHSRTFLNCQPKYMDINCINGAHGLYHPYTNCSPSDTNNMNTHKKTDRRKRKAKNRKRKPQCSGKVSASETETGSSEVIEMEVTQEMIDFYAKTMEHRLQRDKAKKAEQLEDSTQSEHVNVEDIKITDTKTPTVEAPKERPGARRTAEMKLLYGKGAAMIHGMETALQMTFDRNLDVKQPKIWPNMPLRVVFS